MTSERTLAKLKLIDKAIKKIRKAQNECASMPFFDQAVDCLRLAKFQVETDGANYDLLAALGKPTSGKFEAEMEF